MTSGMADHAVPEGTGAVHTDSESEPLVPELARPEAKGRWARLIEAHPLLQRVTGYSAGSVIAAVTSEIAFTAAYGWLHSGTTLASAAGFFGGAVPNYILNRRWAWREDRRGRSQQSELALYFAISLASFAVSAVTTNWAEDRARALTASHDWQVVLVALAFFAVSAVFFIGKFFLYDVIVFTKGSHPEDAEVGPEDQESHPAAAGQGS
jgi:putative flippase GtrA